MFMRWIFVYAAMLGPTSIGLAQDKFPNGPTTARPSAAPKEQPSAAADATLPSTVHFDEAQVFLRMVDRHWQVWAGRVFSESGKPAQLLIKDFDLHEREANDTIQLIRDLHLSQYGVVPGATPPFEFWLSDDAGPKTTFGTKNLIKFNPQFLKVDNVAGAWIIHDDRQMLFNFCMRQEAAVTALAVMKKYNFNRLGAIGASTPVMTYFLSDPFGESRTRLNAPPGQLEVKDIVFKISQQGLLLPGLGYVGNRVPIEPRRLESIRFQGDWLVVQGKDVVVRFGPNSNDARDAMRLLLDTHVNEMCLIGKKNFPIFLCNGQAPRQAVLGFNSIRLTPSELTLKTLDSVDNKGRRNELFCLAEGEHVLFELSDDRADAELVLKVLKHFRFDQLSLIGNPPQGGMRFLAKTK
jgi:hypothetical protein